MGGLVDSSSNHPGGVSMLFGDASVNRIAERIGPRAHYGLAILCRGEVLGSGMGSDIR
jgi:hypothetical protein